MPSAMTSSGTGWQAAAERPTSSRCRSRAAHPISASRTSSSVESEAGMDLLNYLASEAEQVEIVELDNEVTSVEFEANKLKTSRVEETRGIAVRIVRHGRLGFAAATDRNAVNKLASHVMESASYGDSIPLHFPGQQESPAVRNCDPLIAEMPVADLAELGQHMVEML